MTEQQIQKSRTSALGGMVGGLPLLDTGGYALTCAGGGMRKRRADDSFRAVAGGTREGSVRTRTS